MQINIAKTGGFCFGVRRALKIAMQAAQSKQKVYMLGDIVHNEEVIKEITKAGIKKIRRLKKVKNSCLLIRAHGAPLKVYKKAKALGYKIIDATCPMVREIHKIAKKAEKKGRRIIIIGDKKHDEVQGIYGQLKNRALIIDSIENIPFKKIKTINRAVLVVQSTQNIQRTLLIAEALNRYIKNLKFYNTICVPTSKKQEEIRIMPLHNDIMIIIGSRTSANTKRLYEISKSVNPHSYWIQSKKEIKPAWFRKVKRVGIISGASTPESTTALVINQLKKNSPHRQQKNNLD